jgi:uncharacterized phage protein gp47/JayE
MAFTPRTYEEIRDDMIDYVRLQTELTDFEVGSVIRTIIEAAALEDDEQYFQMVQLLDAFRLSTASGQELDDRVEEFGLIRLQPGSSAGDLYITDELLITSTLALDPAPNPGASTLVLVDSSEFPTSGFPQTVRIGEGTINVEDISISANNTVSNTLTLVGTTSKSHNAGERVSLVDGAADKSLDVGIRAQVPAASGVDAIVFITIAEGTLVNGNYRSTAIDSRAEVPGSDGNVGSQRITEFADSPPFDGAGVINLANFGGGRDLETDAQLRDRARAQIQGLSKGTVLALQQGVLGVVDDTTGQRVTTSNVLESFVDDEVIVYIDDGTGFTPDEVELPRSTLAVAIAAPSATVEVTDGSDFPQEGYILLSPEDTAQTEILAFSGVVGNVVSLVGATAKVHDIGDEVLVVDVIEDNAEVGANFFQLANFPVVRNSLRLWLDSGGIGSPLIQGEGITGDYLSQRGTGQIEFTGSGVAAGSVIAAHYTYYTGLIATAQRIIDGDPDDPTNYPGIRSAGINVLVETPVIRRITVAMSIVAAAGVIKADLIPQVQETVEAYINGLGIGEDVIVAEIIERAMAVTGMFNVTVTVPTGDLIILENELPVPFSVTGESLVTVT